MGRIIGCVVMRGLLPLLLPYAICDSFVAALLRPRVVARCPPPFPSPLAPFLDSAVDLPSGEGSAATPGAPLPPHAFLFATQPHAPTACGECEECRLAVDAVTCREPDTPSD